MSKEIAYTVSGPKIAWLLAIVAVFAVLATLGTQWKNSDAASNSDQVQEISLSDTSTELFQGAQDKLTGSLSLSSILSPQGQDENGGTASYAQTVWNLAIGQNLDDPATWISSATIGNSLITSNTDNHNEQPAQGVSPELGAVNDHANGQTVELATSDADDLRLEIVSRFDAMGTETTAPDSAGSLEYGTDSAVVDLSGRLLTYSAFASPDSNPWSTNSLNTAMPAGWDLFHERAGSGEVIASTADSSASADGLVPEAGANAQESTGDSQDTVPASSSEVKGKSLAEGGSSANWLFAALGVGAIALGVGGVTVAKRSR